MNLVCFYSSFGLLACVHFAPCVISPIEFIQFVFSVRSVCWQVAVDLCFILFVGVIEFAFSVLLLVNGFVGSFGFLSVRALIRLLLHLTCGQFCFSFACQWIALS